MQHTNHQIYWITGASRGIGLALAKRMRQQECTLVISGRRQDTLEAAAAELNGAGRVLPVVCDIAQRASVTETYERIRSEVGDVDVLVNNAGVGVFGSFLEMTESDVDAMIDVNLKGAIWCAQAALPAMIERGSGAIVNMLSIAATTVFPTAAVYAAAKAGMLAMSRSLRQEMRDKGIKVLDVLPGATETAIWSDDMLEQFRTRMMQPDDVAAAIVHALQAPAAAMIEEITIRPQLGDL